MEGLAEFYDFAASVGIRGEVDDMQHAAAVRTTTQRTAETIEALSAFGHLFTKAGILGLIEPLGFAISSLASFVLAREAIRRSGFICNRVVHDTFHHYIGSLSARRSPEQQGAVTAPRLTRARGRLLFRALLACDRKLSRKKLADVVRQGK